ncbi:MAG: hypothetical protein ACE5JP_06280 [Candidatus Bipolaricaulia bacterium]
MRKVLTVILALGLIVSVNPLVMARNGSDDGDGPKQRSSEMSRKVLVGFTIGFLSGVISHLFGVSLLSDTDIAIHLILGGIGAIVGFLSAQLDGGSSGN